MELLLILFAQLQNKFFFGMVKYNGAIYTVVLKLKFK